MAIPERTQNGAGIVFKETVYDGISYICPTWAEMGQLNFALAKQIISSNKSEPPFDRIVALARGGWTWARDLADALKIPELSSLRMQTYTGVNSHREPEIVQPLSDPINGQSILLFDEVVDSGVSIKKAVNYLTVMGAREIKIAAICTKPRSEVQPDFYAFSTKSWVVFPHEIREFVEESWTRWSKLQTTEILDRLTDIGIPEEQAAFYLVLLEQKAS